MNILYIVSLENIVGSGIYISQVEELLISVSRNDNKNNITLLYIPSLFKIGRKGIIINDIFVSDYYNGIKNRYESNNINFVVCPFVFPMLKRWGIYLSMFTVPFFLLQILPLLYFIVKLNKIDIIHCRSYLSGLLATLIRITNKNVKFLFDPRGFFPEEGIEHKRWNADSLNYKFWKYLEKYIITSSDSIIGLSTEFCDHINDICGQKKTELIYAGVGLWKYRNHESSRESMRKLLNIDNKIVFIYVGGLGSWNHPEVIASLYSEIKNRIKNSYLFIITNYNKNQLDKLMKLNSNGQDSYAIMQIHPDEVSKYLAAADFGIMPGRNAESDYGISLTNRTMIGLKASEYLASGLPLLANRNIIAVKSLIKEHDIGYLFEYRENGKCILGNNVEIDDRYRSISIACRKFAEKYLNLDVNSKKYLDLYEKIMIMDNGRGSSINTGK
jgi:glycosyltransferase involved in cell wall biosynthesis